MRAMHDALTAMKSGIHSTGLLLNFPEPREKVGFEDYYAEEARYAGAKVRD